MARFHYISPSQIPSRSANSIHVVLQCEALSRSGTEVILYAKRTVIDPHQVLSSIRDQYGVNLEGVTFKTFYSRHSFADTWRIALLALRGVWKSNQQDIFLSRNLYAAFFLGVLFHRPLLFETHQLEYGFRKWMQKRVMTAPRVTTVVISHKLAGYLEEHHRVVPSKTVVLHDAARDGIQPVVAESRRKKLQGLIKEEFSNWIAVCGYFGHLYTGRGIEIIEAMAVSRPQVLFLVFGGNPSDIRERQSSNRVLNLRYMGHVSHSFAKDLMLSMDVLLMPYQESVSIGINGHDTAKWMSPMKMFEYMATGVPIISSDLPVLREVLHDGVNCLMVSPKDSNQWIAALDALITNSILAENLGKAAHEDYSSKYTWCKRADVILRLAIDGQ